MHLNVTQKLIQNHLLDGQMQAGESIGLRFDQTLCQDATGTLVMLALEAMELDRVKTEVSAQYVDHNLLQEDNKNPDDHLFLLSAAKRFGVWFSRPGNGISHPLHMQRFGRPGATLIGSDSHTCAGGCLGMLAVGAGGADVAMAMAGQPVYLPMPQVWGVYLEGELPDWVSAKDVILEMLRRHGVSGGVGKVIEYYGPGLNSLTAMDRHVIANMGAELGATGTVFPSDAEVKRFLESEGRGDSWCELSADEGCEYDLNERINLSELVPLIAKPSSPGNVVPVTEVAGEPIYQAYIGSSANPGYRDFAVAADIVAGQSIPPEVSFDINPSNRQMLQMLMRDGHMSKLLAAGARLHQAGCNGCIGMGQAPATEQNSLRTTPRNFPGRSGTQEDRVWLCSPETAAASALRGCITDPRSIRVNKPLRALADTTAVDTRLWVEPAPDYAQQAPEPLVRGPNIATLPVGQALPEQLRVKVIIDLGDDISTDEILPAGAEVLPYRSNIPKIAEFAFKAVAPHYAGQAKATKGHGGHAIIAGCNYGQGSSREHAALAPCYLGLKIVLAESFARIHRQNLINFGVLPLQFDKAEDRALVAKDSELVVEDLHQQLSEGEYIVVQLANTDRVIKMRHGLSQRDKSMILAGGLVPWIKQQLH